MSSFDQVRFLKERDARRKKARAEHGIKCWLCEELYPKRIPTTLLPGRKCKVCGYRDPRPWMNIQ